MSAARYEAPRSIQQAVTLLQADPGAAILAGGTDLLIQFRAGFKRPTAFVDVKLIPDMVGMYVFGDLCSGEVFGATLSGGTWSFVTLKDTTFVVSGFGEDDSGELYLTGLTGRAYRLESTPYAVPSLAAVAPSPILAGDPGVTLVVTGSNFAAESVVQWNGTARPTVFVSASELHAAIPASDIASIGTADVSVFTPAPGGGTSATVVATIDLPFLDVPPGAFARPEIGAVFNAGVTAGCGLHVYCPTSAVTRAQRRLRISVRITEPSAIATGPSGKRRPSASTRRLMALLLGPDLQESWRPPFRRS